MVLDGFDPRDLRGWAVAVSVLLGGYAAWTGLAWCVALAGAALGWWPAW